MSGPPIHVRYVVRRGDYVAMTAAIYKASWKRSLMMLGALLLLVVVVSIVAAGGVEQGMRALRLIFTGRMDASYYMVMGVAAAMVLLGSWFGVITAMLIYRHNAIADRELNLTISGQGVEGGTDDLRSSFLWSAIKRAIETRDHIFLAISRREAMILPKRVMAAQDLDALRALLKRHVPVYEMR